MPYKMYKTMVIKVCRTRMGKLAHNPDRTDRARTILKHSNIASHVAKICRYKKYFIQETDLLDSGITIREGASLATKSTIDADKISEKNIVLILR